MMRLQTSCEKIDREANHNECLTPSSKFPLPPAFQAMPAITPKSFLAREPGTIQVTPIPIEVPIHSRPILHSAHSNTTFHEGVKHAVSDHFHWGLLLIMIILTLAFAFIMSTWGWNKITGPLWKLGSGWQGSVENMEDEEELLASRDVSPRGEAQR